MSCAIEGCKSHKGRKENNNEAISFYRFPKREELKSEWLRRIIGPNWAIKKSSHICSKHFTPDSFGSNENLKWRRLKADALPTLYLPDTDTLEKIEAINQTVSWLPQSNSELKFRWSTRLILAPGINVSEEFKQGTAKELKLNIDHLNGTDDSALLAKILNQKVENDSGGSMHNTFDEDELSNGVSSILLSTLYLRSQWRSAPTLLNNTRRFYDTPDDLDLKTTRMVRINDLVGYADLTDWGAEAVEISYATPGLSLLLIVPRGHSLRPLTQKLGAEAALREVTQRMTTRRVAVTMPLYTLRMTLLLPNKLRDMGVIRLVTEPPAPVYHNGTKADQTLRITHAVQRIMFWAEAGRNAYKEDGIEWDYPPEMELLIDRPYVFFVRWRNVTLMNGHFVL